MRILITGGFGYLGGRLTQFLTSQKDHEIILGSRQSSESPVWLPHTKVVKTEWNSISKLKEICSGIDVVIHLAGMNASNCDKDPTAALESNGVFTSRLLQAGMHKGVKRFIYLSTAHVYGSPMDGLITEETCPLNLNSYATSHRAGEDSVRIAHELGEIEGVIIRLSNAYGAPIHKDTNCWMLLVNDICRQSAQTQKIVLHSSGHQRRDFIAMTDACRAISHLLELSEDRLANGVFNVGGGWSPSVLEMSQYVAERVYAVAGNRPTIICEEKNMKSELSLLDYDIKKLINTGFNLNGIDHVNFEIDELINFCLGSLG